MLEDIHCSYHVESGFVGGPSDAPTANSASGYDFAL
jgi:hypothetical protein